MKPIAHGADVENAKSKYGITDILDYSSNVNIFSPESIDEILNTITSKDLNYYLDPNYINLRKKIAQKYGLDIENTIVGNGSTELMFLIMKIKNIKKIGIFQPTFGEYERAALIEDKTVINLFYEDEFTINIDELSKEIKNLDLLVICNPNNPSGNVNQIEKVLDLCKENKTVLMIDETFMDFVYNSEQYSLVDKIPYYDNLVIIRALTKFHSLTSVRLGYALSSPSLIDELWKYKEPWTVNIFAQKLIDVIFDQSFYSKSKKYYHDEIARFSKILSGIKGITVYPTQTNFILIRIDERKNAGQIKEEMIKKYGILIRDCSNFDGLDERFIRINIKKSEQNDYFFKCFKDIILKK